MLALMAIIIDSVKYELTLMWVILVYGRSKVSDISKYIQRFFYMWMNILARGFYT